MSLQGNVRVLAALAGVFAAPLALPAQMLTPAEVPGMNASLASATVAPKLPDAPSTQLQLQPAGEPAFSSSLEPELLLDAPAPPSAGKAGHKYSRIVQPGIIVEPFTAKDKFIMAAHGRTTLGSLGSALFTTELGYIRNDVPHYGSNLPAFGQRFGAAEAKATSENLFSYGLFASIFHDDPRYYVKGRGTSIGKRAIYAATRVVITRKDSGVAAFNYPKLAGIGGATALTTVYYPDVDNRTGRLTTSALSSLYTSALTNELHEFIGDALHLVFHKH